MSLRRKQRRRGISLIEVSISTLLVGFVLVASMRSLGHVVRSRGTTSVDSRALALAEQLVSEILNLEYEDDTSPVFGPETGESGPDRSAFDDVDDYHGWTSTPPQDQSGTAVPNSTNWQREVTVQFVDPNDPVSVSGTDEEVKRITVTVRLNGAIVAVSSALRSDEYSVP